MKCLKENILSRSVVMLTNLSRSVLIPFFPLYLKYLNLSLMQMGIIRSFQVYTALACTLFWIKTGNKLSHSTLKLVSISGSIFTAFTICICLLFVPPFKFAKNVTNCENNETTYVSYFYNLHFKTKFNSIIQNASSEFQSESNSFSNINFEMHPDIDEITSQEEDETMKLANKNKNEYSLSSIKPYIENFTSKLRENIIDKDRNKILGVEKNKENISTSIKETSSSKLTDIFSEMSDSSRFTHHDQDVSSKSEIYTSTPSTEEDIQKLTFSSGGKKIFKYPYNSVQKERETSISSWNNNQSQQKLSSQSNIHETGIMYKSNNTQNSFFRKNSLTGKYIRPVSDNNTPHIRENDHNNDYYDDDKSFRAKRKTVPLLLPSNNIQSNKDNVNSNLSHENISLSSLEVVTSNIVVLSKEHNMWSETFFFTFVLAVFYELFSSQIVPWIETMFISNANEFSSYDLLTSQIFISKSFPWLMIYPIIPIVTILSLCPYQITVHCLIAAVILVFAFLAALLFLLHYSHSKQFRSRKLSKPLSAEKQLNESANQRTFTSVTNILIGICSACYVENILWKTETLPGFPYNYEFLYCGYYFVNMLVYFVISRCIINRINSTTINNDDSDSEEESVHFSYEWIMNNREIIYEEKQKSNYITVIGTFFLTMTLFVVPFFSWIWAIFPLALLKGITDVLLEKMVPHGCWSTVVFGYGIGCFLGPAGASMFGMNVIFFSASIIMFICCFCWLSYSIFLQYFKKPYTRISLGGHYDDCCTIGLNQLNEEGDWLEQALQRDQLLQSRK